MAPSNISHLEGLFESQLLLQYHVGVGVYCITLGSTEHFENCIIIHPKGH